MSVPFERRVIETKVFTMTFCPVCKQEYAFTEWDDLHWWFPHICLNGRSVYTVPKEFLSP